MSVTLVPTQPLTVQVTETSWQPTSDLTFDEWSEAGRQLQRMGRAWQFWFGDWMLYGEHRYGEMYRDALDVTGFDVQTLMNVTSVCRRVDASRRREALSFSHHETVAALEPDAQGEWLDRAEAEGMTVARLRSKLSGRAPTPAEPTAPPPPTHAGRLDFKLVAASDTAAQETLAALALLLEKRGCVVTRSKVGGL